MKKHIITIIGLFIVATLTGCASLPVKETLSPAIFTEKGKVVYISAPGKLGEKICETVGNVTAKCYQSTYDFNKYYATIQYETKAERATREAAEKASIAKEMADTGAIARIEEQALLHETSRTDETHGGTAFAATGLAMMVFNPALGINVLATSLGVHNGQGIAHGYMIMRFNATYKDGSKKVILCNENESQSEIKVCRV